MFYLFMAIACSASIALIFKYSENNSMNRILITSSNYFIALIISLFLVIKNNLHLITHININSFAKEFNKVVIKNLTQFSPDSSLIWCMLLGLITGIFYFSAFMYYQKCVKNNGVGISGTFQKLGILLPMLFSIVLWHEIPSIIQWIGILLSLVSILIVNISFTEEKVKFNFGLIILFFLGGMAEFSNKVFQKFTLTEYKNIFLLFIFISAFLISLFYIIKLRVKLNIKEILIGFCVGIPNLFSAFFLILALNYMKASVAFPIYSAGSIVLINIGGFFIFKEKLKIKEIFSIILTIIAICLINF